MKKIILGCFFSVIFMNIQAQNSPENKLGAWYMYNGAHQLSDSFSLQTMAHFRYFETASEFQQGIYRLGLNYKTTPMFNFTLGLSYVETDTQYKNPSELLTEFRIYEDFNFNTNLTKLKLRHRFRFEHRFLELQGEKSLQNWIRYDLNAAYPLSPLWSIYAFNELFLNFEGDLFSQNWTGAGLLYKFNNHIKFKIGYFYQKLKNVGFDRLQFGVILNTDFRKKTI